MAEGYRRSLGLPAVSIGLGMISEVGYLHENPEIEALLLRKGIQPIPESEFLTVTDIALSSHGQPHAEHDYDGGASAHILTGLEPIELQKIRKKGFEGSYPGLADPRSAVLSRALRGSSDQAGKGGVGSLQQQQQRHGDLPLEVASALDGGSTLEEAVRNHVMRRFGSLVLIPPERVDAHRPLDAYGMDSMVGAEFRSWFYKSFGVDVPFLELLGKATTLDGLSRRIVGEIESRN